jgi:hypothetical protein
MVSLVSEVFDQVVYEPSGPVQLAILLAKRLPALIDTQQSVGRIRIAAFHAVAQVEQPHFVFPVQLTQQALFQQFEIELFHRTKTFSSVRRRASPGRLTAVYADAVDRDR